MFNKKVYFNALVFMMMVTTFLPVVSNNLPPIIGSFHLYGPLFIISIICFDTKVLFHKNIIITLIIALFLLLIFPLTIWPYIDDWNQHAQRTEFYFMITALFTFYYYQMNSDYRSYALITNITLVFISITMIMSLYSAIDDPMYARHIAGNLYQGIEEEYFSRLGGGSYGFAAAIMALIPMAFYYYKNNNVVKYSKWVIILFVFLVIFALFAMQFFGNILIGVIVFILSFQGGGTFKRSSLIVAVLSIIVLFIPNEYYARLLAISSEYFDTESNVYLRLTDMSNYLYSGLEYDGTGTAYRVSRYSDLFDTFINAPVLGSSFNIQALYDQTGAHLYWMNRLTIGGIVGLIIFLTIFIITIKYMINRIQNDHFLFYYILSIGSIIGYGLIKDIAGRQVWFMFFFILPGMYYLPLLNNNRKSETAQIRNDK